MLTTSRLLIRPYTLADAPFILQLLNSPGWLKYIGDRNVHSVVDAEMYIQEKMLNSYKAHGHGYYLCERLHDGSPIGTCGVGQRDYLDDPDIGFAFLPDYTGQGYAFEATKALFEYAQQELGMHKMLAFTLPTNQRSVHLLEKIGLHAVRTFQLPDDEEELLLFEN
jgi:RimJ/RimL family protein N-acetyltransferase